MSEKKIVASKKTESIKVNEKSKPGIGNALWSWIIRLVKGLFIGVAAITPGFSGGVLMVVFGVYQPLVHFLANIREKFLKNLLFFIPVGIGGILGVIGFSAVVDYAFTHFAAQFTWLFIGFISGTFPSLIKTAGKEGRKSWHWILLGVMSVGTFFLMKWMATIQNVTVKPNFWIWLLCGALTGLGVVVPGMSPSNFLIYLGLYQPMASGIRHLEPGVILPLMLGVLFVIILLAKLLNWLFKMHYAFMYHLILGIVVGSTAAIIPSGVASWTIAVCAGLFVVGAAASYGLSILDAKHPHESLF